jgi:hypothetical protein
MNDDPTRSPSTVTRRTALVGLGTGGLGLALAATARSTAAQEATSEAMATHPIVGNWMVTTGAGPAMAVFLADGTNIQGLPATQAGPNGVEFVSTQVGSWEPVSERGIHFTGVQLHSDANGTLTGTVTIDAYPTVSEDGQTLLDDDPRSGPIIRDAAGTVVADLRGSGPPATGVRMGVGVGVPDLPTGTPTTGTPTG